MRLLKLNCCCVLVALLVAPNTPAQAGEDAVDRPTVPAVPDFLANRDPLPDQLLKDKRAGTYITGFPAISVNAETGLTLGAAVQWFDNGAEDSPFFRYTPYRRQIAITATGSTGGSARALIGYDQPYIHDSPWRVRAAAVYDRNKFENYFGVGESTLHPLTYPGSDRQFHDFEEYTDALERNVGGQTWARFNDYSRTQIGGLLTVERSYWGGLLRPQVGLQITHVAVKDYTGDSIDRAMMQPTRLLLDHQAGALQGFDGGWDNALKVGLTFDSRDFEPDPASGVMLQAASRISSELLGSSFNYEQVTLSARGYYNLLNQPKRLIAAGRLTYGMQFGDVPFYSAPIFAFTDGDTIGLGGAPTLRGFVTDRFVGHAAMFVNGELRWSFAETTIWRQHLRFMLAPFVDSGRVFDSVRRTTLEDWKVDGGAGLRLAWNLSTIVSFDYAWSSEGSLFYMQLGHQF